MKNSNKFNETYLKMIFQNAQNSNQTDTTDTQQNKTSIDDLVKQNTITIQQNANLTQQQDNENSNTEQTDDEDDYLEDGWSQNIKQKFENIVQKMEDIAYQIRNCKRGSLTNCETQNQLNEYLKKFAEQILGFVGENSVGNQNTSSDQNNESEEDI